MTKREKKINEITLKGILYYVTDEKEQEKFLKLLIECEEKMKDSKIKNFMDNIFYNSKKNYFDKVDFLVEDILSSKMTDANKKTIYEMIEKLQPAVEENQKTKSGFWDKLKGLFEWS